MNRNRSLASRCGRGAVRKWLNMTKGVLNVQRTAAKSFGKTGFGNVVRALALNGVASKKRCANSRDVPGVAAADAYIVVAACPLCGLVRSASALTASRSLAEGVRSSFVWSSTGSVPVSARRDWVHAGVNGSNLYGRNCHWHLVCVSYSVASSTCRRSASRSSHACAAGRA
jgi:hypothetical protein